MRYLLHIIAASILICIGLLYKNELSPHFIAEGVIIIITLLIIEVGYDIIKNWKRLRLVISCWYLSLFDKYIRFSMSYQYIIKINDKYLLVKNSNWGHYQFVGGKYKRLPKTQSILDKFEAKDDLKLPTSGKSKDDFALFIPAKNAIKFLDWFNSGRDREISHWREFYEELIDGKAKLLSQKNFPYVNYDFKGTLKTPLKRASGWDCWEILQYDILELLPTQEQETELIGLLQKGDTDYIKWADYELIQCLGHDNRTRKVLYKIGEHTKWVLNRKWSKS